MSVSLDIANCLVQNRPKRAVRARDSSMALDDGTLFCVFVVLHDKLTIWRIGGSPQPGESGSEDTGRLREVVYMFCRTNFRFAILGCRGMIGKRRVAGSGRVVALQLCLGATQRYSGPISDISDLPIIAHASKRPKTIPVSVFVIGRRAESRFPRYKIANCLGLRKEICYRLALRQDSLVRILRLAGDLDPASVSA